MKGYTFINFLRNLLEVSTLVFVFLHLNLKAAADIGSKKATN